jgi:hypothetical protein
MDDDVGSGQQAIELLPSFFVTKVEGCTALPDSCVGHQEICF